MAYDGCIYTYLCDGSDASGFEGCDVDGGFNNNENPFTFGDYNLIITDNDIYLRDDWIDRAYDGYQYHRAKFTINESIDGIEKIEAVWKARGGKFIGGAYTWGCSLWIKENGVWTKKGSHVSPLKTALTVKKSDDIGDWINSSDGSFDIGLQSDYSSSDRDSETSFVDTYYVEIKIYIKDDKVTMDSSDEEAFRATGSREEAYKMSKTERVTPAASAQVFPLTFPIRFFDESEDHLIGISSDEESFKLSSKTEENYRITKEEIC